VVGEQLMVIERAIDRVGPPAGFQDDGVLQNGIFLEVQADAEIVEIRAER